VLEEISPKVDPVHGERSGYGACSIKRWSNAETIPVQLKLHRLPDKYLAEGRRDLPPSIYKKGRFNIPVAKWLTGR
jgi:hypothetical protein